MNTIDYDMALSFQRGQEKGFTHFFNQYRKALLFYAGRHLRSQPDFEEICKDVVEDSFIKIWAIRDNFNHPKIIRSWLYSTVRNSSLRYLQDRSLHGLHNSNSLYLSPTQDKQIDLKLIQAEVIRELYICLGCLPEKCRQIIEMRYIQEKSVSEICAELNLKITTVKTQLSRGMGILRKKYEIDESEVTKKNERFIKRIYYSIGRTAGLAKLYGYSEEGIYSIRIGETNISITKDLP